MIGEIVQIDEDRKVGRVRAQGNAGTYVFGLAEVEQLALQVGDVIAFSPHQVGFQSFALAIQIYDEAPHSNDEADAVRPSRLSRRS